MVFTGLPFHSVALNYLVFLSLFRLRSSSVSLVRIAKEE